MNTPWDFVEKYYPNYYSSSEIEKNDDLNKIINGEINGQAEEIYNEYKKSLNDENCAWLSEEELHNAVINEIENLKAKSDATIFEESIKNFLLTNKL